MENPLGHYKFGFLMIIQHSATRKHVFLYRYGDRSGLRKPKRNKQLTLITATTSVHLLKSVLTDPSIKSDLVLANPKGKAGVQGWLM